MKTIEIIGGSRERSVHGNLFESRYIFLYSKLILTKFRKVHAPRAVNRERAKKAQPRVADSA